MSVELWVEGICVCGKRAAWPEGGYIPACGTCGWPFAPPLGDERLERGRGLLAVVVGPEKDLVAAARELDAVGAPRSGPPPPAEDVQRWALERGWDPELRCWPQEPEAENRP